MFSDFTNADLLTDTDLLKSPVSYPEWMLPVLEIYLTHKARAELKNAKETITPKI
ncbi:hypothetical protein IC220_02615 [Wolbachia endosymbiont of Pentalonia nigronervosa]|uniref:hypothetical protein n=1 Tax=Wolbachia endosymbiont of Pentalonia nigronervosa TaxID=1301914 RepID=UPI00165F94F9|nr:hypothetical protein [Wolbachia endosymbiont of Pentalonia nigronervosa]MBD0391351.1 hypothetical protein [Wolbachia endosymbiont of Pentalonia nigronervosa]